MCAAFIDSCPAGVLSSVGTVGEGRKGEEEVQPST